MFNIFDGFNIVNVTIIFLLVTKMDYFVVILVKIGKLNHCNNNWFSFCAALFLLLSKKNPEDKFEVGTF